MIKDKIRWIIRFAFTMALCLAFYGWGYYDGRVKDIEEVKTWQEMYYAFKESTNRHVERQDSLLNRQDSIIMSFILTNE